MGLSFGLCIPVALGGMEDAQQASVNPRGTWGSQAHGERQPHFKCN